MATDIRVGTLTVPLTAETKQFISELNSAANGAVDWSRKVTASTQQATKQFSAGAIAMGNLAAQAGIKIVEGIVGAITKVTSSITGFVKSGAFMAGKFQEMEFAAIAVGKQMGITRTEILSGVDALNKAGIRYDVASQTASQFARAQLNLAQAGELANAAQGAAILLQEDSSATMARLVGAIASGSSMTLKGVGITKTFSEMEKEFATSVGKSVDALSQKETMQARLDGVLKESSALTEVYAAAQESPTKKLRSLTGRVIPELQAALATTLLPAWKTVITVVYDFATALTAMMKEGGALYPFLVNIGAAASLLADVFKSAIGGITDRMKGLSTTATSAGSSFVTNFTGRLSTAAQNALTWGINIATQLATGLIRGASSALTAAMKFIGGMLSSWLAPGSPPKVAKNIVKWGTATFSQYLGGFSEASFDVLGDLQSPLKSVLSTLVDAGELGAEASSGLFKDLTQEMTVAIAAYQETGKVSEGLFTKMAAAGGEFGADLADLARKQFALAKATLAVESAERDLEAARQKQTAAQDDLSTKMSEYNELLAAGADPSVLAAKREEFEAAKGRAKLAKNEAKEAEARKKATTGQVKPLQKQVSTQKKLLDQLMQFASVQKMAAAATTGVGGALGDVAKAAGGLGGAGAGLAGLGEGLGAGLGEGLGDAIPNAIGSAIDAAKDLLRSKVSELFAPLRDALAGGELGAAWAEFQSVLETGKRWIEENWPIIEGIALTTWTVVEDIALTVADTMSNEVAPCFQEALASIEEAMATMGIEWGDVWEAVKLAVGIAASVIGAVLLGVVAAVTSLAVAVAKTVAFVVATFSSWVESTKMMIEGWIGIIAGGWAVVKGIFTGDSELIRAGLAAWGEGVKTLVEGTIGGIVASVKLFFGTALVFAGEFVESFIGFFVNLYERLVGGSIVPEMLAALLGAFTSKLAAIVDVVEDKVGSIISTFEIVGEKIQDVIGWFKDFADKITGITLPDWLQSHSPPPLATGVRDIAGSFDKLAKNKAWKTIGATLAGAWKGQLEPAFTEMQTWLTGTLPEAIEIVRGFWEETLVTAMETVRMFVQDRLVPSFESLARTMSGPLVSAIKTLVNMLIEEGGLTEALAVIAPQMDILTKYLGETFNPAILKSQKILENWETGFYGVADAVDLLAYQLSVLKIIIGNLPDLPDDWEIGSPTPAEMAFRGVSAAVRELATVELPKLSRAAVNLPAMGGGYTGASTEYNFAMEVNAAEVSPEAVIYGYETMRALVGA